MNISILVAFFALLTFSPSVMAQGHGAYCKNIDSTAASQKCLTQHLKSAQRRLNKVYVKLGDSLKEEKRSELKDLQKIWLTYRDTECMWEAARLEDMGLKRVNELSCMARITEDRADLLTVAYGGEADPDAQQQFGGFPRWMNVLAKEYPAVYWNYGARLEGDLNCDDQDEHVMTGIKMGDEYPSIHLAVVENPPVGKPKPSLFVFPVEDEEEGKKEGSICTHDVKVEMQDAETEEEDKACGKSLVLMPKACTPKVINWAGKAFHIAVEKEPVKNKKQKKN